MKIGLTSDLHGVLPKVPDCDLLLIGGDLCPVHDHDEKFQFYWLDGPFRAWLNHQSMPVVGVAGNHDFVAETDAGDELLHSLDWTYLMDETAQVADLSIHGSPYSNQFGRWAFMMPEYELAEYIWSQIPKGLDVLITHGPPKHAGDKVNNNWHPDDPNVGSMSLRHMVLAQKPAIHLTGHIHEAYGEYQIGDTTVYNASINNEIYDILNLNPIMVVDI